MTESRTCREWIVARDRECGRPAKVVTFPGNQPLCGIHARAAESRGEQMESIR